MRTRGSRHRQTWSWTKQVDLADAFAGEQLVYTLTVTNSGPDIATGVEVTDDLPNSVEIISATTDQGACIQADPVSCFLGSIGNGAPVEIEIVVEVRNNKGDRRSQTRRP